MIGTTIGGVTVTPTMVVASPAGASW